jgi:anti-anti-sigma factor
MTLQLNRPPRTSGDVTVVHFTGSRVSLDEETFNRIRDELFALADEPSASDLLIDFRNVEYLTSTTLGTLVGLHNKLLARGRRLTVGNLSPQVHQVFAVTNLDRLLDLRLVGQTFEAAPESPFSAAPTVLVVDDEPVVLCVLAARLRLEGYKVWVAGHGRQAVEFYQQHRDEVSVVLLDVLMPGLDGPHTLAALRNIRPTVPCCFMTGDPTPYTEEGLLEMGAVRVFRKPFVFTEVIDTLNQLTRRPPGRRQDWWIETPWKGA